MAIDPTEPELDLSWLKEMPADEDEEIGTSRLAAPNSSLELESLLSDQAETVQRSLHCK